MKNSIVPKAEKVLEILASIFLALAGFCLIYGCLNIYFSGDGTYSAELVAAKFSELCVPVYICITLVIISFILSLVYFLKGVERVEKPMINKDPEAILSLLKSRKDPFTSIDETALSIIKLRSSRKRIILTRNIILTVVLAFFLLYALNINHFPMVNGNGPILNAMAVLVPCLILAFVAGCISHVLSVRSVRREIELYKTVKTNASAKTDNETCLSSKKRIRIIRIVILASSVAAIIYGLLAGGTADVLTKAVNICTECIGLG